MNSRTCLVTSGPYICSATGAESTTSGALKTSTLNSSLSNAHGRSQYFLAKSIDQTNRIASVMDDETIPVWHAEIGY
uniref:Uncharacterized protein n=1 Tax=Romanomermis culicivorax TaxID=13658 RepID=A0A915KE33_ROMCU